MNCISSSDNTTPLCRPSDTFAMMIKAPLHPFDRVRSTNISVERHGLSLFEDLSREMDEFDDDDDSIYDSDIDESENDLEEGEGDVSFGRVSAMITAPLHSADRLRSTNVSVERHCLSSLFEDLSREIDEFVCDDDDDDSTIYDSDFEFEQQQQAEEEAEEVDNIILSSNDDSIRAVVATALQEDKHQDEDEHLSPSSSSRLIVSSARSSNNDSDDDKSRSAAPLRSKVQDAEDNKRGPVVVAVEETRGGDTMTMTLAAKAVELSSSSPPLQHWRATTPRRLAFPRRWLEEDRACIRRR